ncbi:MAG: M1 family aminopeptidase [Planctomycetota bacterium]
MNLHAHARRTGDFALPNTAPRYAPDRALEPVHIEAELAFDLPRKTVSGSVTTTVLARRAGQRRLQLDAVDFERVVVSDPDGREVAGSYDGRHVTVLWAEPPAAGERRRVKVDYVVRSPLTGMDFSWPDEAYPQRARFLATDHETERARHWLPCVDHPAVRTTLDLRLRADAAFTILANGRQTGETLHDDGTKTARWELDFPCPSYLVCLAIGDLVRAEGGRHEDVEVAFFAPPPYTAADLARSFGGTKDMLDWITKKLGAPFPFPKYYQVAVPGIGGAMENISLVTWDDAFVLDETLAREYGHIVERINVHEMAHSYFGDAIVMEDFAHAWLKESWATYTESLWIEDRYGADEMAWLLDQEAEDYMREADERYSRPIVTSHYSSSWDLFDQHLYPGGAWRIHMLRKRVGEGPFWAAVHDYVASYTRRLVETTDFRRKLEEHSGLSLSRFFQEWILSPGYPKLKVEAKHDAERGELQLVIEQCQVDEKRGIGAFSFPLTVAVETKGGEWLRRVVDVSGPRAALVIPVAERPLQVELDPDLEVLKRLDFDPGRDLLERSLSHGSVTGRLHAARTLIKGGGRLGIEAAEKAYAEEPLWGVRVAIAQALGKARSQYAAEALARLLLQEQEPRVLAPLADACGRYRDPAVAAALRAFLEREPPYLARAAAYRSLGAQLDEQHLDALAAGAQDGSWWGWVRRGALVGLGNTRSERARALLAEHVRYGADALQARRVAVQALAECAAHHERPRRLETLELLEDLARDPEYRMRQSVAGAVVALGEAAGAGVIAGIEGTLAEQDKAALARQQARLRAAAERGESKALKKKVEELEGKLRKLEKRLEVLDARAPGT